jgi:hypothetical protein
VPGALIPALSFTSLSPNPSAGTVVASFVVPDSRPADRRAVRLSGPADPEDRRPGAGPHDINLGFGLRLESGLYFVRLSHGDTGITRRLSCGAVTPVVDGRRHCCNPMRSGGVVVGDEEPRS